MPFGSVASYTLGDGQAVTLTYDSNGAWTDVGSSAFSLHVKRDVVGNIVAIGNTAGVPTPTETYTYDPVYRLTGVNAADGTAIEAYNYNKTGDRLSKAAPGLLTGNYNYASGTHHLTGVGTTTRVVDARGNTTADVLASGTFGYGYNDRNRLTVVQNGGVTVGSYVLNALGQRVQKTAGGITTRFDYDENSHLLSESAGTTTRDYIWMDGMPVGIVDHTGSTTAVNFVHADGLGSARVVTNSTGAVLWQWAYAGNPFGEKAPVSVTSYTLNLRFPGQYFDAESGLNYNVNRDYEPATGRYIQSDPLGVVVDSSTYAYALHRPLDIYDPTGLAPPNNNAWRNFCLVYFFACNMNHPLPGTPPADPSLPGAPGEYQPAPDPQGNGLSGGAKRPENPKPPGPLCPQSAPKGPAPPAEPTPPTIPTPATVPPVPVPPSVPWFFLVPQFLIPRSY
jgi:RHS repeat-associated protein